MRRFFVSFCNFQHDRKKLCYSPEPALIPFYAGSDDITTPYISPVYGSFENFPPTLIIAGSDDKTVGNDAPSELKNGIADSELFVYEGLGHGVFEEAKDFYDRVLAFCDQ